MTEKGDRKRTAFGTRFRITGCYQKARTSFLKKISGQGIFTISK